MTGVAVIDSNVLVAGLLTRRPDSPTARIVDGMLTARFRFALSMELLAEYHRVLRYPKVARLHGLSDAAINDFLTELALPAIMVEPGQCQVDLADPDDAFLFQMLIELPEGLLVTGDQLLLECGPDWARVVEPVQFVEEALLSSRP
ncbi:putative toxin-antitoxin system toxin component, PIN family [Wenzhouxiangella sp. EGI_FJ10305]|uniref:putative toxin-antitoxin system toxin component, PIN family n=1 Tax=Wenzhouxiangella sp. EGI_FJ10305 TaxID=3243768 RepID=UPI0035DBACED